MNAIAWYVVETKRHREQVAAVFLAHQGITSYLPRMVQSPPPPVGREIGPLFPGYLFVRVSLASDFHRVTRMVGVKTFVSFGGAPVPVSEHVINVLRSRESSDGLIRCGNPWGGGSEVRIVEGPFRGLTAVLEQPLPASERVRVLMCVLQRETAVELPAKWLRQT
jgi:transcriptional antiterminator RfaH